MNSVEIKTNPLKEIQKHGQSFWLDYIRRSLITSGELKRLVQEGLRGVTSNPTIFQKAIADSSDYDEALRELLAGNPDMDVKTLFETVAIEDIRMAADILRSVYEETEGADGFVSFEVSPHLARDTEASVAEAKRCRRLIDRPNVMLKIPATKEGIPAIETLIAEGINVNITLMFSLDDYEAIAHAYLRGLERCPRPQQVASVASFFVSRIDAVVDPLLESIGTPEALGLRGKTAIANAKMAYQRFRQIFYGEIFAPFRQRGALVQRPLWASTSTKNPDFSDVLYVEELIGPDTVNTVPPSTLDAFREHGRVASTLETVVEEAKGTLTRLRALGIDLDSITSRLQEDGVAAFAKSFDDLLAALQKKRRQILSDRREAPGFSLGRFRDPVEQRLQTWRNEDFACRLWRKDPSLWTLKPVPELTDRLGWLVLPEAMQQEIERLVLFADEVRSESMRHVALLGMGGSSLAPEVFQSVFGNAAGYPELIVLDSTHPAAVRAVEARLDLRHTLFLVSSKSGTTTETLSLFRYFWGQLAGFEGQPGNRFVAITDPGTPLERLAKERKFRRLFKAPPDVGGRYSALSVFGLVPAALIGVDICRLLDRSRSMVEASAFCVPAEQSPALRLGAVLGEVARMGRDKLTLVCSLSLTAFSAWLEQLVAESTGKDGKGIVPVADEPLGPPETYSADRLFVHLTLTDEGGSGVEKELAALEAAGHPVTRISLRERADLGEEFFRWEVAVAAAGAALGVHPFNQPDVELAKQLAREAMQQKSAGKEGEIQEITTRNRKSLAKAVKNWLREAKSGDYLSIQAYLAPNPETTSTLRKIRLLLRDRLRLATTSEYGPRFLHSTGQLHKGGPNTGLFLQLVDQPVEDLPVPETDYTFGKLIHAQAIGDYQALVQRGRRVLRVQLGKDAKKGLARLAEAMQG